MFNSSYFKSCRFFLISCIDIDECLEGLHDCPPTKTCENTEGGFVCNLPEDEDAVKISCPRGFELNVDSGLCEDVNECQKGQDLCLESQRCDNTIGSFRCVRLVEMVKFMQLKSNNLCQH